MKMELSTTSKAEIEIRSRIVREEKRAVVELFSDSKKSSESFLRICSWCKKVLVGLEWHEVEEAVKILQLFDKQDLPQITHTICPACEKLFWEKVEEEKS